MIDLHCHVLPGIDDGPATIEQATEMARAAVACGSRTLVATPHVSARYRNEADLIAAVARELTEHLRALEIPLELAVGAEVALTHVIDLDASQLRRLRLGGGDWLLVEPPFSETMVGIDGVVQELLQDGHKLVLAHPERCPAFQREPRMLEGLVEQGVLTSLTAGSLVGAFGAGVRRFAERLIAEGLVHNVASDAHGAEGRGPSIARELERAGLAPLRKWLTSAVPGAILAGDAIPPRPEGAHARVRAPRQWWQRGPLRRASLSR